MIKMALISDIHGNLHALEAVLKDIEKKGVNTVYCTGDLVGYGARPNEVIELIRQNNIPTVMGNYDDAIGNMRLICGCDYKDEQSILLGEKSVAWTKENTTETNKLWLKDLPSRIRLSLSGTDMLLVHGSPGALNEYLYEDTSEENLDRILEESGAGILVCGHTHLPYVKKVKSGYVVNAGSAGMPKHGNPNVTYVIVTLEGSSLTGDIIEVPYDYEDTAREIENSGLPAQFAQNIRTGGNV